MSRAYCLTCNEQVMMTASGTCASGHPVAAHDGGPEPWVGRASTDDAVVERTSEPVAERTSEPVAERTSEPVAERTSEPAVERATEPSDLHVAELQELHHVGAGIGAPNGNGHAGAANGHGTNGYRTTGHAPNGHVGNRDVQEASPAPMTRHPANSQVSDDLAAMLAEALNSEGDGEPTAAKESQDGLESEDWGDLATLAAELELDGSSTQAESSTDVPPSPEPSTPEPVQPPAATERAVPPPPEPPVVPGADLWTDEPTVTPPSDEDLPSEPSADHGADDVTADAPAPEPGSTSSVDPMNFTARGARVGKGGNPARKLFGRKR